MAACCWTCKPELQPLHINPDRSRTISIEIEFFDDDHGSSDLEPVARELLYASLALSVALGASIALTGSGVMVLVFTVSSGALSLMGAVVVTGGLLRTGAGVSVLGKIAGRGFVLWMVVAALIFAWKVFVRGAEASDMLGLSSLIGALAVWVLGVLSAVRRTVVRRTLLPWSSRFGVVLAGAAMVGLLSYLGTTLYAQWVDRSAIDKLAEGVVRFRHETGEWPESGIISVKLPESLLSRGRMWYSQQDSTVGVSYLMGINETSLLCHLPQKRWSKSTERVTKRSTR